jgi:hypothetical protein
MLVDMEGCPYGFDKEYIFMISWELLNFSRDDE